MKSGGVLAEDFPIQNYTHRRHQDHRCQALQYKHTAVFCGLTSFHRRTRTLQPIVSHDRLLRIITVGSYPSLVGRSALPCHWAMQRCCSPCQRIRIRCIGARGEAEENTHIQVNMHTPHGAADCRARALHDRAGALVLLLTNDTVRFIVGNAESRSPSNAMFSTASHSGRGKARQSMASLPAVAILDCTAASGVVLFAWQTIVLLPRTLTESAFATPGKESR